MDVINGWKLDNGIVYKAFNDPKPNNKFAMFDMDNTLLMTPSYFINELTVGIRIPVAKPVNESDYIFYAKNMRKTLQDELDQGRGILVFSNQRGLLENDLIYRILAPGMLDFYLEKFNNNLEFDRKNSFFVGDAAGRSRTDVKDMSEIILNLLKNKDYSVYTFLKNPNSIKQKIKLGRIMNRIQNDFSDCDYKFALNINVRFYTPEEYFYGVSDVIPALEFDLSSLGSDPFHLPLLNGIILIVGPPASGKSTVIKSYYHSYNILTGTEGLVQLLSSHKTNIVIDSTNHLINTRRNYLKIAKIYNVKCHVIFFDVTLNFSNHFNKIKKDYHTKNVINNYFKRLEAPTLDEGFDTVVTVNDVTFPVERNRFTHIYLP